MSTTKALRGATTVENNSKEDILNATSELLTELMTYNNFSNKDVISIIFTMTKDLDAVFPAVAARNLGYTETALLCTNEIDVPGSLQKCIRILLHFNLEDTQKSAFKNVYLRGAKILRPDLEVSQIEEA